MADMQKVSVGLLLSCAVILLFVGSFMRMTATPEYGVNFNETQFYVFNNTLAEVSSLGADTYSHVQSIGMNQTDWWSKIQAAFSWVDLIISGILVALNLMIIGVPTIIFTLVATVLGTLGVAGGVFGLQNFLSGIQVALVALFIVGGIFRIIFKEQP